MFHPNGRFFYNLYEHDAKVAVYDYDAARGGLHLKQTLSALPPKFSGSNLAAEILITADGRFLYVSNRLHNAIGGLCGGRGRPIANDLRDLGTRRLSAQCGDRPERRIAFSCNQKGDSITSFRINAANGALQFTGRFEPVGSPAVMVMLKPR